VRIRTATDEDWPQVYPFFTRIIDAGETYAYPEGLSSEAGRALWMLPPPGRTVVAVDGGGTGEVVLGTAHMGPNRAGRGAHVATASFMVDPAHAGRGVGRALGLEVVGWAGAAGYRSIQFNAVVETNTAAVALWRSLGFELIGTVPEAFDSRRHGLVGLHVMHLRLPPRSITSSRRR
jgi:L-amino acid N-acyltransferase YncA